MGLGLGLQHAAAVRAGRVRVTVTVTVRVRARVTVRVRVRHRDGVRVRVTCCSGRKRSGGSARSTASARSVPLRDEPARSPSEACSRRKSMLSSAWRFARRALTSFRHSSGDGVAS